MSAVLEAREPSARYLEPVQPALVQQFELLATAQVGVARLRELILALAIRGKLTPRDLIEGSRVTGVTPDDDGPFELPEGWLWRTLGDLQPEFQNGASSRGDAGGQPITVLRLADITNRRVSLADTREVPIRRQDIAKYLLREGDILITRVNGSADIVGQFNLVEGEPHAIYCDHFIRLRVSRDVLDSRYLALFGSSDVIRSRISNLFISTAGQKTVNQSHIGSLPIAIPPLAEQAHIVTRVDELMRLCDALEAKGQLEAEQHARLLGTLLGTLTDSGTPEKLAANWQRVADHFDLLLDRPEAVDALEQTILQLAVRGLLVPQDPSEEPATVLIEQIRAARAGRLADTLRRKASAELPEVEQDEWPFEPPPGWVWTRFGEVTQVSGGVTLGRKGAIASPVSRPYLRVANVQRWKLALDSMKDIVIDATELARYQLAEGDLLITEGGDWDKVGRTAIWRSELPGCLHQNHVFKARGYTTTWNPGWAELYLNLDVARAYFAASAKQTTNLASINMTELRHCVFPLPPLSEQARIIARVTELRRVCAELRQRLAASQTTQSHLAEALVDEVA